ncbi:MAG: PIN domain-containing protein [Desulfobacterota bacterium]|nr:PIN domain-containing protein [Thermodesulfobacteriota bacterium]
MANKVIIDTCIWIEYLRGRDPNIVDPVKKLIFSDAAVLCGIVLCEILQGIKDPHVKESVKSDFEMLPYLEMSKEAWADAALTNQSLRHKGITIPPSDIFIASLAKLHQCSIYTIDTHFKKIPDTRLYIP